MFSDGIRREVHYSLNDLKIAEDVGLIYENVPPARLKRGQGYTYVVLNDGSLVFGEVHDVPEFGVKHLHLANGKPVKAVLVKSLSMNPEDIYSIWKADLSLWY